MDAVRRLAEALVSELERETPAGPEVVRFAETALGGADDAALGALLSSPLDDDGETMAELLLFPDEAMKVALEPLLSEVCLAEAMEPAVARALATLEPQPRVLLPGGTMALVVADAGDLGRFVRRFRMGHGAPQALARAVDAALEPRAALRARVRLRHARCPFSRRNTDLLLTLASSPRSNPGLAELLDFACGLLAVLPTGADALAALRERYEAARRHLEAQARYAERLAQQNFETLTLRGERAPYADPQALRREMHLAERMALVLYGVRLMSPMAQVEDLGVFGVDGVDAVDVGRFLDLSGEGK